MVMLSLFGCILCYNVPLTSLRTCPDHVNPQYLFSYTALFEDVEVEVCRRVHVNMGIVLMPRRESDNDSADNILIQQAVEEMWGNRE